MDSTLECIAITKEDLESFRNQSLLLLTTDEIQDYKINLVGQQQQDNLLFYVFDVSPVAALSGKQYFEGRIWVESRDFPIVKSHGTVVTKREKKRKGQDNPFAHGHYLARADRRPVLVPDLQPSQRRTTLLHRRCPD